MNADEFLSKRHIKVGSRVRLKVQGNEFTGVLLPSSKFVELKLDNGYNAGFNPELIDSVEAIGAGKKPTKPAAVDIKQNPSLPLVTILHTGGTIASRVDYATGGVSPSFDANDLLALFPELLKIARIRSVFLSNIFSEDMRFEHYTRLAKAIMAELNHKPKGIIVTHGTDTMHYTASALSFMFENLPIPIILVGAQRSSDRPSSDAALNTINATRFITASDFAGVAICMHASIADNACCILPGTKTRKLHSSRRDAFRAVNAEPIAKVSEAGIEYMGDYPRYNGSELKLYDKFEERVAIIKARPNMFPEEFAFFEEKKYKGLIIEGTGLGHIGITESKNKENLQALRSLIDSGCVVCMTTQCIFGRVHENVYATGRTLASLGVIFLEDMLSETAFIKLSWLLGNFGREKAAELMPKNLRGEIGAKRNMSFL
ncbi:MAG: Glu-tRNA(Gln) amidotransferase subunit GatD [Candidatus Diapherotrites archaeon]|nr:Glu-tRNA(Gln) amidotransferase subunit GatD [Candidatus Diapherotrites archaeon]